MWAPAISPIAAMLLLLPPLLLLPAAAAGATKHAKYPNALRTTHMTESGQTASSPRVPLLLLIFTRRQNEKRRSWQRATFLAQRWRRGEIRPPSLLPNATTNNKPVVSWKYVYVMAREGRGIRSNGSHASAKLDRVQGDSVVLSAVQESYDNLVYKTLEAFRWALRHVAFGALLKTDDDTIVHIGRIGLWLHTLQQQQQPISPRPPLSLGGAARHQMSPTRGRLLEAAGRDESGNGHGERSAKLGERSAATSALLSRGRVALLYAGRIFNDSQIIRANFSRADLLHPAWYPADFVKWAVPFESYCCGVFYPPYCSGGGYFVGHVAAQRILRAYDQRVRAGRPVVHVEDAFVGILAQESDLSVTDLTDFIQDPPVGRTQVPALFGGQMLVHRVTEPASAYRWLTYPVATVLDRMDQQRRAAKGRKARGKRPAQLP